MFLFGFYYVSSFFPPIILVLWACMSSFSKCYWVMCGSLFSYSLIVACASNLVCLTMQLFPILRSCFVHQLCLVLISPPSKANWNNNCACEKTYCYQLANLSFSVRNNINGLLYVLCQKRSAVPKVNDAAHPTSALWVAVSEEGVTVDIRIIWMKKTFYGAIGKQGGCSPKKFWNHWKRWSQYTVNQ